MDEQEDKAKIIIEKIKKKQDLLEEAKGKKFFFWGSTGDFGLIFGMMSFFYGFSQLNIKRGELYCALGGVLVLSTLFKKLNRRIDVIIELLEDKLKDEKKN